MFFFNYIFLLLLTKIVTQMFSAHSLEINTSAFIIEVHVHVHQHQSVCVYTEVLGLIEMRENLAIKSRYWMRVIQMSI